MLFGDLTAYQIGAMDEDPCSTFYLFDLLLIFFFCFASIILCLQIVFCTMAANNNTKIVVPLTASLDQTLRDLAVPHMVQQSLCIQYQPLGAPFELKFGLIQLFPNFMVWRMRIRINILRSFIFFAPVLFHRAFQKNRSN